VVPVLNFFPDKEFTSPETIQHNKVRVIWFSQNITFGRGLEILLSVWKELEGECELTLIGNPDPLFEAEYLRPFGERLCILPPLDQSGLHRSLAGYDIGLALEVSTVDMNKDLALSNKILAYFQAGLYIVATDTSAQVDFMDRHPAHGKMIRQDGASLLKAMKEIVSTISLIRSAAGKRFIDAREHCWEAEAKQLETLWQNAFLQ
jgi:hypothetical protein